ncbi:MAG: 16S rRNA (cytosine(1402)-N(4))-methyltransferase RsmH [Actinomycetota bacterium]
MSASHPEQSGFSHVPVLAAEVVAALAPGLAQGGVMVDCTLGGGGHAAALLAAAPEASLVGFDRDPDALAAATRVLEPQSGRVTLCARPFSDLGLALAELGVDDVRGVLYDLGVSSPHLDRASRGFGYRIEGPLDMRMDPSQSLTAASIVNGYPEVDLARVLARWGEERFARRIAAAIVRRRTLRQFETTTDLADVVREAIPAATRRTGPHPARRTFQALRIEVNDELGQLEASLPQAISALQPGGRVAVISYHSLEDRLVKRTFTAGAVGCRCPRDLPVCACGVQAQLRLVERKAIRPSERELQANPRAASARLRVAERLALAEVA